MNPPGRVGYALAYTDATGPRLASYFILTDQLEARRAAQVLNRSRHVERVHVVALQLLPEEPPEEPDEPHQPDDTAA